MYALKHKGKILGTFKKYTLLLEYVSNSKLGIYQVSKDNEKFAIIVNGNQFTTYLYDKETCKEIFRTYFRWFVMASYIKKLRKMDSEIIEKINNSNSRNVIRVSDLLATFGKKKRVEILKELHTWKEKGIISGHRTSAVFMSLPNGIEWSRCKSGSRNEKLFETYYLLYDNQFYSHIYKFQL